MNLSIELKKLEKRKLEIESEIRSLEKTKAEWDSTLLEIRDLPKKESQLKEAQNSLKELTKLFDHTKREVDRIASEVESLEKKLTECKEEKTKLEILISKFDEYEKKNARIQSLLRKSNTVKERIDEIEKIIKDEKLEGVDEKLKLILTKVKECEVSILKCDELFKERERRLRELETTLKKIEDWGKEIKKLATLQEQLKIFKDALESTQFQLREEFITSVSYTMNKLWPTLYPYKDFVGIRLHVEEGDYVLQLQERGGRFVNADGIASGGERTVACLALRTALALVLAPHLRFLVLDEPTANLDSKAIVILAQALKSGVSEFIDQCFIITHQEELEEAVTGNAYRLERDKFADGFTKVVRL
jgi:DNA repair exonuclease SbcCD ATPase subunit